MQEFLDILSAVKLFDGINKVELLSLLNCLNAQELQGQNGQILHNSEDNIDYLGIVVCGRVHISTMNTCGVETSHTIVHAGGMFGAILACSSQKHLPLTIISDAETVIVEIKINKIVQPCSHVCKFHNKIVTNLLACLAEKYVAADTQMQVITKRSIREKALAYLQAIMLQTKSNVFDIPLNRQELADYLAVDRSSLSYELGKLKELGCIDFRKNSFTIIDMAKAFSSTNNDCQS